MLHGQYPAPGYRRSSRRLSIPQTRLRGAFCGVRPLAVVPFSRIVSEAFLPQALLGAVCPLLRSDPFTVCFSIIQLANNPLP